jgi:hypothetical protein
VKPSDQRTSIVRVKRHGALEAGNGLVQLSLGLQDVAKGEICLGKVSLEGERPALARHCLVKPVERRQDLGEIAVGLRPIRHQVERGAEGCLDLGKAFETQ